MAAIATTDKNEERRKRVFLGTLPSDFLRINATSQQQQEAADQQAAIALQQQMVGIPYAYNSTGKLSITVGSAKLAKNYGVTRMDPYVRLRVGLCVYETHTDPNGGKNPRWNKVIQCLLPQGVNMIYLEIFDECSFKMDELIAWARIPIPTAVMNGETREDWFLLSGKQGDDLEGSINLVLSYSTSGPVVMVPNGIRPTPYNPVSVYTTPPPAAPEPPVPQISEKEIKQIEDMFPNMDKEVIKSVYEANRGNKDGTVNSLLQMSE
ncbi:toll-interacting protein-like [Ischnura elegans]|uniref:toll-interacting protein-like n=1 Tax=Ischnura elegans TaxID=197161 RepID=UPI001ED8A6F7|nr:toll-interacting protein-like [Ischnura elegans]